MPPSILVDGITEAEEGVSQSSGKLNRGQTHSEWYARIYARASLLTAITNPSAWSEFARTAGCWSRWPRRC